MNEEAIAIINCALPISDKNNALLALNDKLHVTIVRKWVGRRAKWYIYVTGTDYWINGYNTRGSAINKMTECGAVVDDIVHTKVTLLDVFQRKLSPKIAGHMFSHVSGAVVELSYMEGSGYWLIGEGAMTPLTELTEDEMLEYTKFSRYSI